MKHLKCFVYCEPFDMIQEAPVSNALFIFIKKKRKFLLKILYWFLFLQLLFLFLLLWIKIIEKTLKLVRYESERLHKESSLTASTCNLIMLEFAQNTRGILLYEPHDLNLSDMPIWRLKNFVMATIVTLDNNVMPFLLSNKLNLKFMAKQNIV